MGGPGRATHRLAGTQDEVGGAVQHWIAHAREVGQVERSVGVAEGHHRGAGRREARRARGPEASPRLVDHGGAVIASHLRRAVGGPVVHHDGPVARRQAREDEGQGERLVEGGEHHVDERLGHGRIVARAPRVDERGAVWSS
jgi:hypothetical protein